MTHALSFGVPVQWCSQPHLCAGGGGAASDTSTMICLVYSAKWPPVWPGHHHVHMPDGKNRARRGGGVLTGRQSVTDLRGRLTYFIFIEPNSQRYE